MLGVGYGYWRADQAQWQTMVFLTSTLAQMAHVLAIRSGRDSLGRLGLWSNKPLLGVVTLTLVLQLALVYVPFLQRSSPRWLCRRLTWYSGSLRAR